jgi:hypothetical protein
MRESITVTACTAPHRRSKDNWAAAPPPQRARQLSTGAELQSELNRDRKQQPDRPIERSNRGDRDVMLHCS